MDDEWQNGLEDRSWENLSKERKKKKQIWKMLQFWIVILVTLRPWKIHWWTYSDLRWINITDYDYYSSIFNVVLRIIYSTYQISILQQHIISQYSKTSFQKFVTIIDVQLALPKITIHLFLIWDFYTELSYRIIIMYLVLH